MQVFNPALARILRVSPEALVDLRLDELPGFDAKSAQALLDACAHTGAGRLEFVLGSDGGTRHLEAHAREADGNTRRVELVIRDVTERRLMEQGLRLMEANVHRAARLEAVRRLAGGVAHEFNNILSVILGTSERLLRDPASGSRTSLEDIRNAAVRAAAIARDLLRASERRRGERKPINLNRFLEKQRAAIDRLLGYKVRVELSLTEAAVPIVADESLLEEVLFHVVLYVSASPAADTREHHIELRTSVFVQSDEQPFVALDLTYHRVRGFGTRAASELVQAEARDESILELAEASDLLAQEGGFLERLESDEGSQRLRLAWPLAYGERTSAESIPLSSQRAPSPAPAAAGAAILLVDDERALRDLLATALSESGFQVLSAGSGAEALTIASSAGVPIGLLLTDVVMPGMDGPTLARELSRQIPNLRVCFISGYTASLLSESLREWPDATVLEKPFSLPVLVATAEKLLGR